jgi:HD-like signal output (HDOD) protein
MQRNEDRIKDLPVMPEIAAKIMNMSEERLDLSFKDLESIIKVDPGLTAKILKIANSALYARQREINSLQTAITLLGFKNIRNLVLLVSATRMFPRLQKSRFHAQFWKHSILSAFMAREVAGRCGRKDALEEAFLSGLLHDVGQAVLFNAEPEQYERVLEAEKLGAMLVETIEEQLLGVNHRVIGGDVLARWNFPELYVDVALEHESFNIASSHKSLVILVSVGCLVAEKIVDGALSEPKREVFLKLSPYTCIAPSEIDGPLDSWHAGLKRDPLYQEFGSLFGIT